MPLNESFFVTGLRKIFFFGIRRLYSYFLSARYR